MASKQMVRMITIMKKKEDRISTLPDDLIHYILSFLEARLAVQTSVLSKRWKLIWTTLPFLNLYDVKFIHNFLSHRDNESEISKLNLIFGFLAPTNLVDQFISYAISHKVQVLSVDLYGRPAIKFSTLNSTLVKKLTLTLNFGKSLELSDCWSLPVLTTLHLIQYPADPCMLPESYLICLPSLRTLFLDRFVLPESINLPALETLSLRNCSLPTEAWDLPALLTLKLDDVVFPEDTSDFFSALVNLQNLVLFFRKHINHDWVINCPQLVNLYINSHTTTSHSGRIIVLSRKIRNFCSVGFFPITFEVSELKHVNIKVWDSTKNKTSAPMANMETYYDQATDMFSGLGSARTLTLDLDTIEVLSSVSDFLVRSPPPFYNLKYVRIPPGYIESSMSTYLKGYILGRSPKATIVTTCHKKMIPQTAATSVADQNVVIEETLAAPTKVLVETESINKTVCIDTVDVAVQEEHVVQNSEVHADRVRHVGPLVEGKCNDQVSSSKGNGSSGLWRGLEVKAEFVCLLDQIMSKYPRTFEHLTTKNKFCKMKLKMLCTSVIEFTKTPLTEVDTEMIAEYRDIFADLQKLGFNVSWLVNRLNYIEQLRFSQPYLPELHEIDCHVDDAETKLQDLQIRIDDAKIKLQDLQTLRAEKMQEIQKPFGNIGTNLAVGNIGYDLLSGP